MIATDRPLIALSPLDPGAGLYSSEQQAASAALLRVASDARHEWGGVIVEYASQFGYTPPVTSGQIAAVQFAITVPDSFRVVALYHTHPCRPANDLFSYEDVKTAVRLKLRSYLRACGGEVYLLDPKKLSNEDRQRLRHLDHGPFRGRRLRLPSASEPPRPFKRQGE